MFILSGLILILVFNLSGKEIIVGGTRGIVELIQFDTKKHQTIFDKGGSLHGLSIGELNPDYPSQEVVAVDEDGQLKYYGLIRTGPTASRVEIFHPLPPGRNV